MAKSKSTTPTEQEAQLIEKFRSNRQLLDLFNEVTKVYEDDPTQFKDLNAIETYLLEKVRAIGNNALERWTEALEKEVVTTERGKQGVRKHSKKNSTSLPC